MEFENEYYLTKLAKFVYGAPFAPNTRLHLRGNTSS